MTFSAPFPASSPGLLYSLRQMCRFVLASARVFFALCLCLFSLSVTAQTMTAWEASPLLAEARSYLDRNQFARALPPLEAHLKKTPGDLEGAFLQALAYSGLGRTEEAMTVLTKLTEDFPEAAEPYNNLAVLYARKGEYEQARVALEMAVRANPGYAAAHENLGDIYARLASRAYRKAESLDTLNKPLKQKLNMLGSVVELPPQEHSPRRVAPTTATPALPF